MVVSATLLKLPKNWVISFTIIGFTWGLANDLHICKKYEILAKHSNFIQEIIQYQMCVGNHNTKLLQLDQQHEVPKFQNNLIYYAIL